MRVDLAWPRNWRYALAILVVLVPWLAFAQVPGSGSTAPVPVTAAPAAAPAPAPAVTPAATPITPAVPAAPAVAAPAPAPAAEAPAAVAVPAPATPAPTAPVAATPVAATPAPATPAPVPAPTAAVAPANPASAAPAAPAAVAAAAPTAPPAVAAPQGSGSGEGSAAPGFLRWERVNVLIIVTILLLFVGAYTFSAQRGKQHFIRRIGGLAAVDDAIGRATEMGKPVLYVPGIMDMDDIQTIAGVTILGHVAKKTAEYDTPLWAPMTRSFTMSVAQEVVKQAYLEKGRADAFRADRINYLTDDQFGYVAGVGGIMMREKPAACFYLGTFYAESLILAETGNSVGAIQIAGTAEPSQIPFFVAACDYTLIGEELFAASAYLSRNPQEVGSLKGQDMSKLLIMAAILVGAVAASVAPKTMGPDPKKVVPASEQVKGDAQHSQAKADAPKSIFQRAAETYLSAFTH